MNTCKKGFYIASERPAALLLDLPLRSIPPTALRLWVPPIHVARALKKCIVKSKISSRLSIIIWWFAGYFVSLSS